MRIEVIVTPKLLTTLKLKQSFLSWSSFILPLFFTIFSAFKIDTSEYINNYDIDSIMSFGGFLIVFGIGLYLALGLFAFAISSLMLFTKFGGAGKFIYEITDKGILKDGDLGQRLTKWNGVKKLVRHSNLICVHLWSMEYYVIPRASFETEDEYNMLIQKIESKIN